MAHIHIPSDIPAKFVERSSGARLLGLALVAVGAVAFFITLGNDPLLAWKSYVVNWLFFTSLAMGAVMFAAVTTIVKAKWNWSVRRIGVAFAAFLPVAFLLLLPMVLGLREEYFPWMEMMEYDYIVQKKEAYLNIPFLVSRQVIGALLLFGVGIYFAYLAVRPDAGLAQDEADEGRRGWLQRISAGWLGQEREEVRSWNRMGRLAPALALLYAVVMSIFSFDWAMSLEPHWFSTIFGAWFFMGAFWAGIVVTALTAIWLKGKDEYFDKAIGKQQLHDLGKLSFAFCVFWTYLFWSQYIVIWYGKLPWEQAWIIHRAEEPWGALSLATVILCFVVPFAGLIGRKPKMMPKVYTGFGLVILVGLWLERYLLIFPSLHHEGDPIFQIWTPLIGLGFLGLFLLTTRWFLSTFPVVQMWQPPTPAEMFEGEKPRQEPVSAG